MMTHEQEYSVLNQLINQTLDQNFIIQQIGHNPDIHRTITQTVNQRKIDLMLPNKLATVQSTYPRLDPINSESTNKSGFTAIHTLLDDRHTSLSHLRYRIHNQLTSGSLNTDYLDPDGNTYSPFKEASSIEDLQNSHKFHLLDTQNLRHATWYNNFPPLIILPATTLSLEENITLYDFVEGKSFIFAQYDTTTVIIYTYNTLKVAPNIESKCIMRTFGDTYTPVSLVSTDIVFPEKSYNKLLIRYKANKFVSPNMSKHAPPTYNSKPLSKTGTLSKCLEICMKKQNHPCFDDKSDRKDLLRLNKAVYSLLHNTNHNSQDNNFIYAQIFNSEVIELLPQLSTHSLWSLASEGNLCNYSTCAFFVWKYKVTVVLHETDTNKQHKSLFFKPSRWKNKVVLETHDDHVFDQNIQNAIYVKTRTDGKYSYTSPLSNANVDNFILSLSMRYSFLDEVLIPRIIKKMTHTPDFILVEDSNSFTSNTLLSSDKISVRAVYPDMPKIIEEEGIPRGMVQSLFSWSIIFLLPFDNNNQSWEIISICPTDMTQKHQDILEEMKANLINSERETIRESLFKHTEEAIKVENECEWGFIMCLIVYMVSRIPPKNGSNILSKIRKLRYIKNLADKTRKFTIRFWSGQTDHPEWLESLLDEVNI